ncbi:uncharacterized protein E5676_scaffold388G00740 [Cucumis melo var. makuwa]|uniref:Uncharacterized protein n=3 Tax=Cucumis melo TaxID=3656 RepID=A0A5D3BVB9_CUCMM|nr:hypothetical protein [Cucumis melo subsp. melo]TYK02176.1 uncharacterized protein E5676_scaffold388G00740 [Cucumis melo var. makuwa]
MTLLDRPDDIEAPNIQVWNNAAFDNGESDVRTVSWSNMQDSYKNLSSQPLQSDCSKENLCPLNLKTPASGKYPVSVKPLNRNGVVENSQRKPFKTPRMVSAKMYGDKGKEEEEVICKERNVDEEIEETEREINRLATRLKALQIEKAEQKAVRTAVQRGARFVPIRSVDSKASSKNSDGVGKMFEDSLVEPKICKNRGLSLGPSEIHGGIGARRQGKTEITPAQRIQNRRQSCLPKLLDIDEVKAKNRRGNSFSLSPKSRRTLIKAQTVRKPATTIVSKRPVKKDGVFESIQPKKLFKDVEKSVPPTSVKKPLRTGRIIASRYNQTNESSQVPTENRKRSLPGNCKDDGSSRYDKRRSSSDLSQSKAPQSRVKKRWDIPNEIMILQQEMEETCLESVSKVGDKLPRIRTTRCANMSPRDSGPAKRVSELIGSKTSFFADEEMEALICQKLNFAEDEEE